MSASPLAGRHWKLGWLSICQNSYGLTRHPTADTLAPTRQELPVPQVAPSMVEPASQHEQTQDEVGLAGGSFVGRHREMAALKSALDIARRGRVQFVMLAGEPGIGKTRIAREFTGSLHKRIKPTSSAAPSYPDGLTKREVDVIRLVAVSKTDREIAEELVIGVRTVQSHVSSILSKLGSANRTEAANYASRAGLT